MESFRDARIRMARQIVELDSHKGMAPGPGWQQEIAQILTFTIGLVTERIYGEIPEFPIEEVLEWITMIDEFSKKMTYYNLELLPDWRVSIEYVLNNINE